MPGRKNKSAKANKSNRRRSDSSTEGEIEGLEQVVAKSKAIIDSHRELIDDLSTRLCKLETENEQLRTEIGSLRKDNDDFADAIYEIELDLSKLNQYGRRENLQIKGIPNNIKHKELEPLVIKILSELGVKVQHYDIVACHRLHQRNKSKPADTIVRFLNRKHCAMAYKNKKVLREKDNVCGLKNLIFIDNLCPSYKALYKECYSLKHNGEIKSFWTYQGTLYINKTENKDDAIAILHKDDLDYHVNSED